MACCSTWICHPVLARVLGFNCAVHLTGIYSQAVQAVRLVAIRLSRSPIIMTHFVAVAQRTANSRGSLPIPWMTSHVPRPSSDTSCSRMFNFRLPLISPSPFWFPYLPCRVLHSFAFALYLPTLHYFKWHLQWLPPAPPALAALLTIAAPATARQNYLLGKIKSFALLCGAEGVGWNGRVSQTRESLKLCQGHSAPTCPDPLPWPLHGGKFEKLLRKRKTAPQTLFNFQCPPPLHSPPAFEIVNSNKRNNTNTQTPTHTNTQIANGNSFRQVFKTCRQAYRPQDMPESGAIICLASSIEMINDICLSISS